MISDVDPAEALELLKDALAIIVETEERLERGDHQKHVRNFIRLRTKALGVRMAEVIPSLGKVSGVA